MNEKQAKSFPVSANNPCPFLRGLVAEGTLADDIEPCARSRKKRTRRWGS